ncbi:Arc family DNA-binding protein [Yersinia enterocolitica]|nr:Arc family DNA-binding protein [Yersinia enterocolitica]
MTEKEDLAFIERFTVRMPDGMRGAIAERAKQNGRSMNAEIVQILEDALGDNANSKAEINVPNDVLNKLITLMEQTIELQEAGNKKPT